MFYAVAAARRSPSNIEDFINGLDPRASKRDWTDLKNNVDARNTPAKSV